MDYQLQFEGAASPCWIAGSPDDANLSTWRQLGFYGGPRDRIPYKMSLRPNSYCIDVGANIGLTAVMMASMCKSGHVVCFEPSPKNFGFLQRSVELNRFNNVTLVRAGVGAQNGEMLLEEHGPNSHSASVASTTAIKTDLVSLDNWVPSDKKVDFLKVDVEGYERDVLLGAEKLIARSNPIMLIEFNSLTTITVGRMIPHLLLDQILEMFPIVAVVDRHTGLPRQLGRDDYSRRAFVGENLTTGFLDDLLCYFDDGQMQTAG